jgi:hypothetical protein
MGSGRHTPATIAADQRPVGRFSRIVNRMTPVFKKLGFLVRPIPRTGNYRPE